MDERYIWLQRNGRNKRVKVGFSWVTFIWGVFAPLFQGEWWLLGVTMVIEIVSGMCSTFTAFWVGSLVSFIFGYGYNYLRLTHSLRTGWGASTDADQQRLDSLDLTSVWSFSNSWKSIM